MMRNVVEDGDGRLRSRPPQGRTGDPARALVAHAAVRVPLPHPPELVVYNPMGILITYLQVDRALVTGDGR